MGFRLVHELAADRFPVAVTCRMLNVSQSGYYEWRNRPPSARETADGELTVVIERIHYESCVTNGAHRVHAELRLARGQHVGRKRVTRLMGLAGLAGISHRRKSGKSRPLPAPHDGLVKRQFATDRSHRLWFTDITEHTTATGKVYCCAVLDCFTRRVVG